MRTKYQPSGKAVHDQWGWNTIDTPLVHNSYNVGIGVYSSAFIIGAIVGTVLYILFG